MAKSSKNTPRSSKRVVELRVTRIIGLMSRGATNREIRDYVKSEWGLSNTQAHRYLQKATDALVAECEVDRKVYASKLIHSLQLIQQKSFKDNDLKAAIQSVALLARVAQITS